MLFQERWCYFARLVVRIGVVSGLLAIMVPSCGIRGFLGRALSSFIYSRTMVGGFRIVIISSNSGSGATGVNGRCTSGCPSAFEIVSGRGNNRNSAVGYNVHGTINGCFGIISNSS